MTMDDLIRALPSILRAAGEAEEVWEAAAMAAWRACAGERLRGCAVPFRLYRRTLVVAVPDHTWQKQLEAMSGQLLFRLNSLLGQALVTYLEFRIDPQSVQTVRAKMSREANASAIQSDDVLTKAQELSDAAAAIKDENLRQRFLLAAGSCLSVSEQRQKNL